MANGSSSRLVTMAALWLALASLSWSKVALASDALQKGQRFEIVGDLYAYGVAHNLNTKELSTIRLEALQISGPEVISRQSVLIGSIMTVIEREPRKFLRFLYPDRYLVQVTGLQVPPGIPVVIALCCGIKGKTIPLRSEFFRPLP
jgi:hypothetical protein